VSPEAIMTTSWLILLAYLAGSVNFSILLVKLLGRGDPRLRFSGNPGTTNVTRQVGTPGAPSCFAWMWPGCARRPPRRSASAGPCPRRLDRFRPPPRKPLSLVPRFQGRQRRGDVPRLFCRRLAVFALLSCAAWVAVYAAFRTPFIGSFSWSPSQDSVSRTTTAGAQSGSAERCSPSA